MAPKTTREKVEELLAEGKSPREIAAKLDRSTQVIYYHLNKLNRRGAA